MSINRVLHNWYAFLLGYFWLPCPLCGREFGGHEWKDRDGRSSVIPDPNGGPSTGIAVCPDCTRAGKGSTEWGGGYIPPSASLDPPRVGLDSMGLPPPVPMASRDLPPDYDG
jgi:hypothetical protein